MRLAPRLTRRGAFAAKARGRWTSAVA